MYLLFVEWRLTAAIVPEFLVWELDPPFSMLVFSRNYFPNHRHHHQKVFSF